MMYLDLDELPRLFRRRWLWSASRPALARFKREDHVGPVDQPLSESVRDLVELETGNRPAGTVRLLTNLSYFGYCFNPVSFYYCFDASGEVVEYIVVEVNNTPWGERDCYVMSCGPAEKTSQPWRFSPRKKMHVSPFMPMEIQYDWALTRPGQDLNVFMANLQDGERIFAASLNLQRTEISAGSLSRVLVQFPLQTLKIIFAIHWEAARLWLKRCPVYTHPGKGVNSQVKAQ
jgi:DUF1365 family protein